MMELEPDGSGIGAITDVIALEPIGDLARGIVAGYTARIPDHALMADPAVAATRIAHALDLRRTLPTNCFLTVQVAPWLLTSRELRDVWFAQPDLRGLIVELHGSRIVGDPSIDDAVQRLHAAGATIALADAGSGPTALQRIVELRPGMLTVSADLANGLDVDGARAALVRLLGRLADRIDAWLLADGVATIDDLDLLASLGVPLARGPLLGPPVTGWSGIDPTIARRLVARRRVPADRVGALARNAPASSDLEALRAIAGAPEAPSSEWSVLLDDHARPIAAMSADELALGVVVPGIRMLETEPIREALQRAMARDAAVRFTPVLVIDDAGSLVGIVEVDRLIAAMIDA